MRPLSWSSPPRRYAVPRMTLPGPTQASPSPHAPPAPRPRAAWPSLSKVDQSRLILTATTAVVSLVLLIWLLVAPTFQPRAGVFATLVEPGEPAPGGLRLATRDAGAIGRAPDGGRPDGVAPATLLPELRRLLDHVGNRPVVLYFATPGVGDGTRMRLLVDDGEEFAIAPDHETDAEPTMEA